jgi:hypothetical protein
LLARLLADAPPDRTDIAWFLGKLGDQSFGLLVLVMAIVGLTPGIASFSGFLLAIPSIQMILGHENPALPAFIAKRSISTPHFAKWVNRILPPLRYAEALVHPRLQMSPGATKRVVGFVNLIMAVTITFPVPFAYIIPTLVIVLIAFAYLEGDGLLLGASFFAALLSLAFSIAQILAALKAFFFILHIG